MGSNAATESQVTSRQGPTNLLEYCFQFFQQDRDDERASIVVRRISFRIVWHREYCVLYDSSVVSHPLQMIQLYSRKTVENLFRVLRRNVARGFRKRSLYTCSKLPMYC